VTASTAAPRGPAGDPADSPGTAAGPGRDRLDPALIKLALALMLGSFASGLDTTIASVALDRLGRSFGAPVATVQWVTRQRARSRWGGRWCSSPSRAA
jgi:hypothetical protein